MTPVHEETRDGYKIRVVYDDNPINPRTEFDNIGTMVCFSRSYQLGDPHKHDFRTPEEFRAYAEYRSPENLLVLPLYLYDHSGITIRTSPFSCPWDSGQVGWIYMEREDAISNWGKKYLTTAVRKAAIECMEAEVREYDEFLTGQVFGFIVSPEDDDDEYLDSCWGFFGNSGQERALQAANHTVDFYVEEAAKTTAIMHL